MNATVEPSGQGAVPATSRLKYGAYITGIVVMVLYVLVAHLPLWAPLDPATWGQVFSFPWWNVYYLWWPWDWHVIPQFVLPLMWWLGAVGAFGLHLVRARWAAAGWWLLSGLPLLLDHLGNIRWWFEAMEYGSVSNFWYPSFAAVMLVVLHWSGLTAILLTRAEPRTAAPAVAPDSRMNGLAVASVITGALGWLLGPILGHAALRQIRQRGQRGAGLAYAGIVLGTVGTLLFWTVLSVVLALNGWDLHQ